MKLIQVKYLSADNTQGARFSASIGWDGPLRRITKGYDYALGYDENVLAAARQLVAKIWETNAPEVVPDVGKTRTGFDVVRLKFEKEKNDLSDCLFNMYDVKNALSDEILKQPKDCDGTDISIGDCLDDAILFLETLNAEAH